MAPVEFTDVFCKWWNTLSEQEQDDSTAVIELLEERGVNLRHPLCSGIEGSKHSHMRELRIQSHGDPIRIFYAFDPRRVAVLLIGGLKSGNERRFYKVFIAQADKLYDEHLNSLKK